MAHRSPDRGHAQDGSFEHGERPAFVARRMPQNVPSRNEGAQALVRETPVKVHVVSEPQLPGACLHGAVEGIASGDVELELEAALGESSRRLEERRLVFDVAQVRDVYQAGGRPQGPRARRDGRPALQVDPKWDAHRRAARGTECLGHRLARRRDARGTREADANSQSSASRLEAPVPDIGQRHDLTARDMKEDGPANQLAGPGGYHTRSRSAALALDREIGEQRGNRLVRQRHVAQVESRQI